MPTSKTAGESHSAFFGITAIDKARMSFKPRANMNDIEFDTALFRAVSFYRMGTLVGEDTDSPSQTERRWKAFAIKAEKLHQSLDDLPDAAIRELIHAGMTLEEQRNKGKNNRQSDGRPLVLSSLPRKPTERKLAVAGRSLEWLAECFRMAAADASQRIKGPLGRAPDEAKYDFVRILDHLYRNAAENPRNPYIDRSDNLPKGELIEFIKTVFHEIGLTESRQAIYMLWRRSH